MSAERFLQRYLNGENKSLAECANIVDAFRRETGLISKDETFVNYRVDNPKWEKLVKQALTVWDGAEVVGSIIDYAETRGLTLETLKDAKVGWLPASKLGHVKWDDKLGGHDALVFPYFSQGRVVGIRYRNAEGSKSGEAASQFCLWGLDDLDRSPSDPRGDITCAIVVEGESDRLRMRQLVRARSELNHCEVVSTPTGTFKLEWKRDLEGIQRKILVPQSDFASQKLTDNFLKAYALRVGGDGGGGWRPELLAATAELNGATVYQLPWRRGEVGKDVCEWCVYHDEEDLALQVQVMSGDQSRRFMTGHEFGSVASGGRKFVIEHLLASRQVAIIGGQPKHKKTWLALNLIRSTIHGEPFCGIPGFMGKGGMKWLIVEEEGDAEELLERASNVLAHPDRDWRDYTFWAHHLGCRLDDPNWIDKLITKIEEYGICDSGAGGVLLDPLQRMTIADENSSTEQGVVWNNIHKLTTKFPELVVVILHHFGKDKEASQGGLALRGSSRHWAEADLGIFIEKKMIKGNEVLKVGFDGRTLKGWGFGCDARGYAITFDVLGGKPAPDLFDMYFEPGGLIKWDRVCVEIGAVRPVDDAITSAEEAWAHFVDIMAVRGTITIADAAKLLGVSATSMRRWVEINWADKVMIVKGKILWRR